MPFDVNGRPVSVSRVRRLFSRRTTELTIDDPDLVPVAGSADDAVASSAVLDAAADFDPEAQSVLWHLLSVPSGEVERVLALVGQDNYVRVPLDGAVLDPDGAVGGPDAGAVGGADVGAVAEPAGREAVAVARVQRIDAMHVSQERSRMASVAARHGGDARSWRVLQPRA